MFANIILQNDFYEKCQKSQSINGMVEFLRIITLDFWTSVQIWKISQLLLILTL